MFGGDGRARRLQIASALALVLAATAALATLPGVSAASGSEKAYSASFEMPCIIGTGSLNVQTALTASIQTTGPTGVEEGQEVHFTGTTVSLTGPVELSEAFAALGATEVRGSITRLVLEGAGGTAGEVNVAKPTEYSSGLPFVSPVERGQPAKFALPTSKVGEAGKPFGFGPLKVTGRFPEQLKLVLSASAGFVENEEAEFKATGKGFVSSISAYSAGGTRVIGPLPVDCSPPAGVVLGEVPIAPGPPPPPALTITSISPDRGPAAGGTLVTITGTKLEGATAVDFGGVSAMSFTVLSPTTITAVTPPSSSLNPYARVAVTTPLGTGGAQYFDYEPAVTSVTPNSGPTAGGTAVAISATDIFGNLPCEAGFCEQRPPDKVRGVKFGTKEAMSFTRPENGVITAIAPPGTGTVDIYVETFFGTSPPTPADRYTYVPPIEHLSFSGWPLSGSLTPKPLGQPITLPSGSVFNGSGELNTETNEGPVSGTFSVPAFKASPKLFGFVPVTLGMSITQSGAIAGSIAPSKAISGDEVLTLPVKLNLGFSSVDLLGLTVPTKCSTSEPLSLTLTDTLSKEALTSKGWSFSGTTTIPKISCEGGLLGALYGEVISGLISGAGAGYSLSVAS